MRVFNASHHCTINTSVFVLAHPCSYGDTSPTKEKVKISEYRTIKSFPLSSLKSVRTRTFLFGYSRASWNKLFSG